MYSVQKLTDQCIEVQDRVRKEPTDGGSMSLNFIRKFDMGVATGNTSTPDVDDLQSQDTASISDNMSLSKTGPRTYLAKHNGKRIGVISKVGPDNDPKWVASHDVAGIHPTLFTTQNGAKAGMAQLHSNPKVTKIDEAYKKEFTDDQRKDLAKEGKAMPDGSYPITNTADLKNAISTVGLGSAPKEKIKAHIKARAKDLGAEDQLPDSWKDDAKKGEVTDPVAPDLSDFKPQQTVASYSSILAARNQNRKWGLPQEPKPMQLPNQFQKSPEQANAQFMTI
jgi:hypothetical protein